MNYRIEGPPDGVPVLLSGSIGSDLRMWDPQVGPLTAAGYRVVRYDHRGHGGSPVPEGPYTLSDIAGDALALLDRLGIERAHWVGLSLGGMTGMWVAQHAADRLRSLTLVCTSADLSAVRWDERGRMVRAGGMRATAESSLGRWFTPEWRTAHPELERHYADMIAGQPVEGYVSCCAAIGSMDIAAGLPGITAPTLVISGAQDVGTPPAHGKLIAAAIPGARFDIVDPAAHLATVEAADEVNALILAHLRTAHR
ncbi:3-oxoadipate enol-lactonase [Nocardia sp. 2]|uniref:3-oxoadipate enol-lactonase n=1 Tax=Nocardia acididurans TaxID=2802282 RepID=A0ABS1MC96_9NOCA|nr:3-oxoadipate enol-lactonase [Nocardia acididurans]